MHNTDSDRKLVLASTSIFRKELLQRLRLPFTTHNPDVDEQSLPSESPGQLVQRLSESKARAVEQHYPGALIIGSDQVAVSDNLILGKPGNHAAAVKQLISLSGKRVEFLTGVCLIDGNNSSCFTDQVPYYVEFRDLDEAEIERYLKAEQPYNCAGSFKSEGLGISLFRRMEGDDPTALIGLPLIRLVGWLKKAGVTIP